MIFDECYIKPCFSLELDVGAGEEIEGSLLETAL